MAQWRVKEISDLTQVSVRMLHHYDEIGLLKPAGRSDNNYRCYSEQDLARLQQIIALKFFGFSLMQIKDMLQQKLSVQEHLLVQQQMLKEQTEHLQYTQDVLSATIQRYKSSKSLDWNNLIKLIERYRMAEEIKKTWVGKLSEKQQERYIARKQEYPKEIGAWEKAIELMNNMQLGDPEGPEGERFAKIFTTYLKITREYEEKHKDDKYKKISNSKVLQETKELISKGIPLSKEANMWFAKALVTYRLNQWKKVYQDIVQNLDSDPKGAKGKKIAQEWREIVDGQRIASQEFSLGIMLWQEAALGKSRLMPEKQSKQESSDSQFLIRECKVKNIELFLNPSAVHWLQTALNTH